MVERLSWCYWTMEKPGFGTNQTYSLPFPREKGVDVSTPVARPNSSFTKAITAHFQTPQNATNATNHDISRENLSSIDPAYIWSVWDRVTAVFVGYSLFTIIGMLYLRSARKRELAVNGRLAENIAAELLAQAGGVMKVVPIIGIEMLAFPLHCGVLLGQSTSCN